MTREYPRYDFPYGWEDRDYCPKCGRRVVELRREYVGFGHHGERNMEGMKVCPARKHWWDGHWRWGWTTLVYLTPPPTWFLP